jgi:uncharacterized protein Yka (UPF0111/DUF47 family)
MSRQRWFLPETPDLIGLLRRQLSVTRTSLEAFTAWAGGDEPTAQVVRDAASDGDAARRELMSALRVAFVTPLDPEDVFTLSRGIDRIQRYARDLVNESEAMATPPDARIAEMATLVGEAARQIDAALASLPSDRDEATGSAEAALDTERRLEHVYYNGMADLLELADRTERIARRELYRRCVRIGEAVVDVAERVVYAVVKQS